MGLGKAGQSFLLNSVYTHISVLKVMWILTLNEVVFLSNIMSMLTFLYGTE